MTREEELKKVKEIIEENYNEADCGIYFTRNICNDVMNTLFKGKYFQVDICYGWAYFEIFGAFESEQKELTEYYFDFI